MEQVLGKQGRLRRGGWSETGLQLGHAVNPSVSRRHGRTSELGSIMLGATLVPKGWTFANQKQACC